MSFTTLVLAILNNPLMAELTLPINITALPINIMALPINVMAFSINVIAPFINVAAPPINALNIQLIEAKVTTNYSRDLTTLAKIYIKKSKYSGENNNFYDKVGIL